MSKFWEFKNIANSDEEIELRIDGEIIDNENAWIYEWFGIPAASPNLFRNELSEHKGKNITVWIDSYGGSVFAGIGIYNALKNHDGKITTIVDGKAMSSGHIISMSGDKVLISLGAMTMAHNARIFNVSGEAKDLRKYADYLDEVKEAIVNIYENKTGKSREEIKEIMDNETFMSANTAINEGFADEIWTGNKESIKIENHFDFSLSSIQNSASQSIQKFLMIAQNQETLKRSSQAVTKPVENIKEKGDDLQMEIKNIQDLKNTYPNLVTEIENKAKDEGTQEERNRLKGIDEIANTLDSKLVTDAKYGDQVMNAEKLAFEAIKNDQAKGKKYLGDAQDDISNSGAGDVTSNGVNFKTGEEESEENIAAMVDAANEGRF